MSQTNVSSYDHSSFLYLVLWFYVVNIMICILKSLVNSIWCDHNSSFLGLSQTYAVTINACLYLVLWFYIINITIFKILINSVRDDQNSVFLGLSRRNSCSYDHSAFGFVILHCKHYDMQCIKELDKFNSVRPEFSFLNTRNQTLRVWI